MGKTPLASPFVFILPRKREPLRNRRVHARDAHYLCLIVKKLPVASPSPTLLSYMCVNPLCSQPDRALSFRDVRALCFCVPVPHG